MPASKKNSEGVINEILESGSLEKVIERLRNRPVAKSPLPPGIPRTQDLTWEACHRRLDILSSQGAGLDFLSGRSKISDLSIFEGNIENLVGFAQIPVGVIGPLRINGRFAHGDYYVPLATTEGALVASYNRGAKIISLSGGATALCLTERVSRSPGFVFSDIIEAGNFSLWCVKNFDKFREIVMDKTNHGRLQDMKVTIDANHVYLIFEYTTGDAAGQNMVTISTDAVCRYIVEGSPVKPIHWFIECNMSGDKKATALSYMYVRGKKVTSEARIPRKIFNRFLHTEPEKMMEYWKMAFVGGVQSGSIGVQGHYANGLAALFIACGQDAACVAEASVGVTRVDVTDGGDLYISATLPNLIVGTMGGGTMLPTQKECLTMMDCSGTGTAGRFAEICAATALAGEISIMGAIAAGHFSSAHEQYGRKKTKPSKGKGLENIPA